jgi:hypothetical protein
MCRTNSWSRHVATENGITWCECDLNREAAEFASSSHVCTVAPQKVEPVGPTARPIVIQTSTVVAWFWYAVVQGKMNVRVFWPGSSSHCTTCRNQLKLCMHLVAYVRFGAVDLLHVYDFTHPQLVRFIYAPGLSCPS